MLTSRWIWCGTWGHDLDHRIRLRWIRWTGMSYSIPPTLLWIIFSSVNSESPFLNFLPSVALPKRKYRVSSENWVISIEPCHDDGDRGWIVKNSALPWGRHAASPQLIYSSGMDEIHELCKCAMSTEDISGTMWFEYAEKKQYKQIRKLFHFR